MAQNGRQAAELSAQLHGLARRYQLPGGAEKRLDSLLKLLVSDPRAPTSVRDPARVIDDHFADSLEALRLGEVCSAKSVADLGSGAGLPGLALAIALPQAGFTLVESSGRKCAFIQRAIAACELSNAEVAQIRIECWEGEGRFELATARALAPLEVVVEYAAPLLAIGGTLAAWRGRRDPVSEQKAARAAAQVGLKPAAIQSVRPYPEAENRNLHLFSKVMETPDRFPRRPGVALKRPLGSSDRCRPSSDRIPQ